MGINSFKVIVFVLILFEGIFTMEKSSESAEKSLAKYLHEKYENAGRDGRPVMYVGESTNVDFQLALMHMDVDESAQVLYTSMWVLTMWKDEYLTWDPKNFSQIEQTRLENDIVWNPDILLHNTAEPEQKHQSSLLKVAYDGSVTWMRHQNYKSFCFIKVPDFPFDHQVCRMQFGSWTHTMAEINLTSLGPAGIDLAPYHEDSKESTEWNITSVVTERKIKNNSVFLVHTLYLKRKVMFSTYILTLPCVFLASLTLVVFCMPPERPDRTGLGMSIFASFLVLLLILVEAAPSSASSVPKLGIYYCFNMVIIILSIFLSSCVVNIHRAGVTANRIPYYIRVVFFSVLGRLLLVQTCESPSCKCMQCYGTKRKLPKNETLPLEGRSDPRAGILFRQISTPVDEEPNQNTGYNTVKPHNNMEQLLQLNLAKLSDMKTALCQLLSLVKKKEKCSIERQTIILEWQLLAKITDRLLCVIYLAAIIGSLIFLFPTLPFMKEVNPSVTDGHAP